MIVIFFLFAVIPFNLFLYRDLTLGSELNSKQVCSLKLKEWTFTLLWNFVITLSALFYTYHEPTSSESRENKFYRKFKSQRYHDDIYY